MRITQWGEYSVHLLVHLARRSRGELVTVGAAELAAAQGIALDYTQQILLRLRDGNIVESVRGPRGGYRLARPASAITVLDILQAAEGAAFEIMCESKPLSTTRCGPNSRCFLRPFWYGLQESVNSYLSRYTLEDLLAEVTAADAEELIALGIPAASGQTRQLE